MRINFNLKTYKVLLSLKGLSLSDSGSQVQLLKHKKSKGPKLSLLDSIYLRQYLEVYYLAKFC